ncbi:putative nima interactive protein [Erysiphe necator]|uniref:Putative nima interactive protein n=1 Tax=Uncinula necator TaxID=52586 RepID=A0A0B1PAD1_UNCNE|nr:putative nima interactive protein [Erysiphe necator]
MNGMDSANLNTASQYLNNQLLSRGFLRHGQNINFAQRGNEHCSQIQIIRLVHDLILHHDRDATQRESMVDTVRALRADSAKLSVEVERYKDRENDVRRKMAAIEAEKTTFESRLGISEANERRLKLEVEKLKATVGQVRTMCAIDCRKRDKIMDGLKKTISDSGHIRGGKRTKVREIVVVGGIGREQKKASSINVDTEGYDLRSETNEFLTELAKSLSEDNENLSHLLWQTLDTLKNLSGWSSENQTNTPIIGTELEKLSMELKGVIEHVKILLTNPNYVPLEEVEIREEEILRLREGWEHMEQRWKDTVSLIDSWRKRMMCSGETVNIEELKMGLQLDALMPPKDESLDFNLSVVREESEEEYDHSDLSNTNDKTCALGSNSQIESDMDKSDFSSSSFDDVCDEFSHVKEDRDLVHNRFGDHEARCDTSSMSPYSVPKLSPLHEITTNTHTSTKYSPTKPRRNFSPSFEDDTIDLLQLDFSPIKAKDDSRELEYWPLKIINSVDGLNETCNSNDSDQNEILDKNSTNRSETSTLSQSSVFNDKNSTSVSISTPQTHLKCVLSPPKYTSNTGSHNTPTKSVSIPRLKLGPDCRLPRPRDMALRQSPLAMTRINGKLAASAREADAARVRAKLKAVRYKNSAVTAGNNSKLQERECRSSSTVEAAMNSTISPEIVDTSKNFNTEESCRTNNNGRQDSEIIDKENSDSSPHSDQGRIRKRKAKETCHKDVSKNRRRRRKSTLTSWELEKLIVGDTDPRY